VDIKRSYGASSSTAEVVTSQPDKIRPPMKRGIPFREVVVAPLPEDDALIEKAWQNENAQCGSMLSLHTFCDAQQFQGVDKCASQPLKGDVRPSVKCRVTDEWMLKGSSEQPATWWVRLQVRLMKAKVAKYQKECHEDKKKGSRVCLRCLQHITRAVKFISKASSQGVLAKMSGAEQSEIQKECQVAQNNFGQSMMSQEQMQMFERLVNVTNEDQHGLQTAPIATIKKAMKVLEGIVLGDPDPAEKMLKELEEAKSDSADPEPVAEMADEIQQNPSSIVESIENTVSDLDESINTAESDPEDDVNRTSANATALQGSLVQLRDGEAVVKWASFIAIAALLVLSLMYLGGVIVTILLVWVSASVFGCAAYSLGRYSMARELDDKKKSGDRIKANGTIKTTRVAVNCMAMFISAPFRYIFKGAKAVYSLIPSKGAASASKAETKATK